MQIMRAASKSGRKRESEKWRKREGVKGRTYKQAKLSRSCSSKKAKLCWSRGTLARTENLLKAKQEEKANPINSAYVKYVKCFDPISE